MKRLIAILISTPLLLVPSACSDSTGPGLPLPVTVVFTTVDGADSRSEVTAEGRLGSLLIQGGPRLTCGVADAAGDARLRADTLWVRFTFTPPSSCPFQPVATLWDAILTDIPGGTYQLQVFHLYFRDQGEILLLDEEIAVAPQTT